MRRERHLLLSSQAGSEPTDEEPPSTPAGGAVVLCSAKRHIALVGLSGAGKSVMGKALAACLGVLFYDLDAEIAREACASIPRIFRREGERGFRRRERRLVLRLLNRAAPSVLALGAGAVVDPYIRQALARRARRVWVCAVPLTAFIRAHRDGNRPLLRGAGARARYMARARQRAPHYARADVIAHAHAAPKRVACRLAQTLTA